MADLFGFRFPLPQQIQTTHIVERVLHWHLRRAMAFSGLSIDDVVNNPIAKNQVRTYYKLACCVERRGAVLELERQWNALDLRSPC
jgi:hypothetical protein